MSAIVSPRPSWLDAASTIIGVPPSWAMPASNDSRVRVDGLSKITATACGPVQRAAGERCGLERVGEVEDLALLGRA